MFDKFAFRVCILIWIDLFISCYASTDSMPAVTESDTISKSFETNTTATVSETTSNGTVPTSEEIVNLISNFTTSYTDENADTQGTIPMTSEEIINFSNFTTTYYENENANNTQGTIPTTTFEEIINLISNFTTSYTDENADTQETIPTTSGEIINFSNFTTTYYGNENANNTHGTIPMATSEEIINFSNFTTTYYGNENTNNTPGTTTTSEEIINFISNSTTSYTDENTDTQGTIPTTSEEIINFSNFTITYYENENANSTPGTTMTSEEIINLISNLTTSYRDEKANNTQGTILMTTSEEIINFSNFTTTYYENENTNNTLGTVPTTSEEIVNFISNSTTSHGDKTSYNTHKTMPMASEEIINSSNFITSYGEKNANNTLVEVITSNSTRTVTTTTEEVYTRYFRFLTDSNIEMKMTRAGIIPYVVPNPPLTVLYVQFTSLWNNFHVQAKDGEFFCDYILRNKPTEVDYECDDDDLYTLFFTFINVTGTNSTRVPPETLMNHTQYHQWIVYNIPGSNWKNGIELFEYMKPKPMTHQECRIYVFLLFKQKREFFVQLEERKRWRFFRDTAFHNAHRGEFTIMDFVKKYDLDRLHAANFLRQKPQNVVTE